MLAFVWYWMETSLSMVTSASGFEAVPERVVLSGDGLREMGLPFFRTFVRTLSFMGIDVAALPEAGREEHTGLEASPGVTGDFPLYLSDFHRVAEETGVERGLATRTWGALKHNWYLTDPKNRRWFDIDSPPSEWVVKLFIEEDVASLKGLKHVVDRNLYKELHFVGPKTRPIIASVVKTFESQLTVNQDDIVKPPAPLITPQNLF